MKDISIDPKLFIYNRRRLVALLPANAMAVFNANDEFPRTGDQHFTFRQNSDLFYLTGINQEQTMLLLYPNAPNPKLREVLLIRRASEETVTWEGKKLSRSEATAISGIQTVRWTDELDGILKEMMADASYVFLNSNEYPRFSTEVPYRDLRFARSLREQFPAHDFQRAAPLMLQLRMVKSQPEIQLMQEAINLTAKAFERVLKFVRPGVWEYEVEAEISHEFTFAGARGFAYAPIIASGENGCFLHYVDNNCPCKEGELLLMDFGAEYANYAADLTRTIPVSGRFSDRQRACYEAVLRVQRKAIDMFVPGNTIDKLNQEVNLLMEQEMVGLGLLTEEGISDQDPEKPMYLKYYMHGTSHFLGLDVHDVGSKYEPFRSGMVFTVEPGLYIREEKLGIRLENNILVTEGEPVDLTAAIPIDPDDIEKRMTKG